MITFIIGLVILFVGAALYGKFCEENSCLYKRGRCRLCTYERVEEQPDQPA